MTHRKPRGVWPIEHMIHLGDVAPPVRKEYLAVTGEGCCPASGDMRNGEKDRSDLNDSERLAINQLSIDIIAVPFTWKSKERGDGGACHDTPLPRYANRSGKEKQAQRRFSSSRIHADGINLARGRYGSPARRIQQIPLSDTGTF
jgi:hypothetical protein